MPTFDELLQDKTKYPDDQKIVLADGVETTLGSVRAGYLRQQDYTQKTQGLAREREAVSQDRAALQTEKEEAERYLADLAKQVVTEAKGARPATEDVEDDPRIKAVKIQLDTLNQRLEDLDKRLKGHDETLQTQERVYYADKHRAVLSILKRNDPDLDTEALIEYAKQNHIPYLDVAYKAFRHDHLLEHATKKAKEDADKAGYERGKLDSRAPSIPPRKLAGPPSPEAPKTFEEAAEAAARDPEILAAMEGLPGV